MKLIALHAVSKSTIAHSDAEIKLIPNTEDPSTVALDGITRIDLHFPKFTDGRAYSQAFMLRRAGFKGEIRATGDVLIDQLVQMKRMGFDTAVLRDDQNPEFAAAQFARYAAFYQGDAVHVAPHFAKEVA